MNVFDIPDLEWPLERLQEHMRRVKEYVRTAADPNETGPNGRNLLILAIPFLVESSDDSIVADLLQRGADPNTPSPWATFTYVVGACNSISLVRKFIEHGLRLNDVFDVPAANAVFTRGQSTLLDYMLGIRSYLTSKTKNVSAAVEGSSGNLSQRRQFIDETIALLELRGAKRAIELEETNRI